MLKKIIVLFIIWRILLFLFAFIAPLIIPSFGNRFPYVELLKSSYLPNWLWSFGNFDGVHYLGIAQHAYSYQYTQAFFPLYPIIIKIASYLTLGNYLLAALIVSNIFFLCTLLLFYKFVALKYHQKTAFWSCIFLSAFPTSFYFGAVYTESLFLFLIICSFYLYEKEKLWQSYLVSALSSGTRLIGLFVAPFLIKKKKLWFYPFLVVPLGFLAYVLYLKIEFNNPLYFLSSQEIFGQARSTNHIVLLPQVFFRYLKIILTTSGLTLMTALFELGSTIFAYLVLMFSYKKIDFRYLAFAFVAITIPTFTGTLASMPRYILVAFPIYIYLAMIKNIYLKCLILTIFIIVLFIATILFVRGYWVA